MSGPYTRTKALEIREAHAYKNGFIAGRKAAADRLREFAVKFYLSHNDDRADDYRNQANLAEAAPLPDDCAIEGSMAEAWEALINSGSAEVINLHEQE